MQEKRLNVLVVDDEEVVLNGLSKSSCFPNSGYCVVGKAADGKEALALMQDLKPDLIVTDINMPVMDGLSFIAALRDLGDDTAVLILSCYDDFHFAQQAIRLDVAFYLLKPFTDEELTSALEHVRNILLERRKERQVKQTEQFLLQGKDSVLLDLLRRFIVCGKNEEIIHNIHCFGLMPQYSFYCLIYFRNIPTSSQESLHSLLSACELCFHLLEINERDCLVLICSNHVSACRFSERSRNLSEEWRQALALPPERVLQSAIFPVLKKSREHFLLLLAKANHLEKGTAHEQSLPPNAGNRKEISIAIDFIEEHLCEEALSLNMVAENIHISPFYFSRIFAQAMGMSFVHYVNTRRVEKACILLKDKKLRIYEISKAIGFQNETYFHQVFKNIKKITPKKYQQGEAQTTNP